MDRGPRIFWYIISALALLQFLGAVSLSPHAFFLPALMKPMILILLLFPVLFERMPRRDVAAFFSIVFLFVYILLAGRFYLTEALHFTDLDLLVAVPLAVIAILSKEMEDNVTIPASEALVVLFLLAWEAQHDFLIDPAVGALFVLSIVYVLSVGILSNRLRVSDGYDLESVGYKVNPDLLTRLKGLITKRLVFCLLIPLLLVIGVLFSPGQVGVFGSLFLSVSHLSVNNPVLRD